MTGHDEIHMQQAMDAAIACAWSARTATSPNPWVGAVVLDQFGSIIASGATEPPGGRHAEIVALASAGERSHGSTMVVTLEPCAHHGRTPPCTDAIIAAGVSRVVVSIEDPDERVGGSGIAQLRSAGIDVSVGLRAEQVTEQLRPYLHHRRTGWPWVVLKTASTLDGRTSAADGSSRWITGPKMRAHVHRLRAESDAVVVGAGTVRADDPKLTVRLTDGRDPLRVVLGAAPPGARIHPCLEWTGDEDALLDELGGRGCLQVLVEGGAQVARSLLDRGLVNRWELHLAPALALGNDGAPVIAGPTAATIDDVRRGSIVEMEMIGDDVRIVVEGFSAAVLEPEGRQ
jgi:diaminohydroxyphosphoribosylaminopyrimidine deaminase/5-amino-6-(5-phosphoribosylamino)uracil reductase